MLGEEEAHKAGLERWVFFFWRGPFSFAVGAWVELIFAFAFASIALPEVPSPTLPSTPELERKRSPDPVFEPYTDEPPELDDGGILLQQRQIIQGPLPIHPPLCFLCADMLTRTVSPSCCCLFFGGLENRPGRTSRSTVVVYLQTTPYIASDQ